MLGDSSITDEMLVRRQVLLESFISLPENKLCSYIDLRKFGLSTGSAVTNITVQELAGIHPKLMGLNLSHCDQVTDVGMWAIARHCLFLQKLYLDACDKITNVGIRSLSLRCSALLVLDLSDCPLVDDLVLTVIASGSWQHLEELYLRNCIKVSDNGIAKLAQGQVNLRVLDLTGCSSVGEYGDRGLREIGGNLTQLRTLLFSAARRVEDSGILSITTGAGSTASGGGCKRLEVLTLSGCENVSKKGLRSVMRHLHCLRTLTLRGCRKLNDSEVTDSFRSAILQLNTVSNSSPIRTEANANSPPKKLKRAHAMLSSASNTNLNYGNNQEANDGVPDMVKAKISVLPSLTALHLIDCPQLTDRGVAAFCQQIGSQLMQLSLIDCRALTDYCGMIIGGFCTKLRELDLTNCGHFSDSVVHTLAPRVSCLTLLRLDGNRNITTRGLLTHIGKELEFVEMATKWLGYSARGQGLVGGVEQLIAEKEALILETYGAIKIQSMIRRKFALRIYWARHRSRLLNVVIPWFQAHVRGYLQRAKFQLVKDQIYRIRMATRIANAFRIYAARLKRLEKLRKKRLQFLIVKCTCIIQKVYRASRGRIVAKRRRNVLANERLKKAKMQARFEVLARRIQRIVRGHAARRKVWLMLEEKRLAEERARVRARAGRFIQRVIRGKLGRMRAVQRRQELWWEAHRWSAALILTRVYRGLLGRLRFKRFLALREQERRRRAIINIQRSYRGYRGAILASVARALKILRQKQQFYAVEVQRFLRGCVGRMRFAMIKERATRRARHIAAAKQIQRVFRGHKGREARDVEKEMQSMEKRAKPLLDMLRESEEKAAKLRTIVARLAWEEERLRLSLDDIVMELQLCNKTTNKYTDSTRINNTPQRFLTKFLRVRLQDHLEHEQELQRVKLTELNTRRGDLRDAERDVAVAKRELIPLTTGLISDVKRKRTAKMRHMIRLKKQSVLKIQALWRRAIVRFCMCLERNPDYPHDKFLHWTIRHDPTLSEEPFYFNLVTEERLPWKKRPIAYTLFGDRTMSTQGYS